jgi:hypothetical protein
MSISSQELRDFLSSSLGAIKKGIDDAGSFTIDEPIEFNLAVVNIKEGSGGVKIYVANADTKFKSKEISRIKIRVQPNKKSNIEIVKSHKAGRK